MPRRHFRTYRRGNLAPPLPAPVAPDMDEAARPDTEPGGIQRAIDYRPVVAVIAIVIFGLGLIAFLLTLRAFEGV